MITTLVTHVRKLDREVRHGVMYLAGVVVVLGTALILAGLA